MEMDLWKQYKTSTIALLFCICLTESYEVKQIGNDVIPSGGGPDVTGGSAVFLMKDAFPEAGVLFAFSAYFRNRNPLQFQVWRPSSNTTNNFTLLAELRITPSVADSAELVYIVSQLTEKCVRVRVGDRLGLYFANTSSSLAQTFNRFDSNPQILVHYVDGQPQSINTNETLAFDLRVYPYDFSLTAFYYLDSNSSSTEDAAADDGTPSVECPRNQLIEGDATPSTPSTPIPTGIPGQIGAVGPSGGVGLPGYMGSSGSVGMTGATGNVGPDGSTGSTGYAGAIGRMVVGHDGATGSTGQNGSTGATGSMGPIGPVGQSGPPGLVFYTNETDFNDTTGIPRQQQILSSNDRQWKSEAYMQGILIWLAIVSLILIILFIVLGLFTAIYRSLRKIIEDVSRRMNLFGMSNTLTTELPSIANHGTVKSQRALDIDDDLKDMREETFTNYEVDTMEKYATKKLKDLQAYDEAY